MARNRKGQRFETNVAEYLRTRLHDDGIERRVSSGGTADRGDIAGVHLPDGSRVVVECKNEKDLRLWCYLDEAEAERENDGAALAVVCLHVPGVGEKTFGRTLVAVEPTHPTISNLVEKGAVFPLFKPRDLNRYSDGGIHTVRKMGEASRIAVLMELRRFCEILQPSS